MIATAIGVVLLYSIDDDILFSEKYQWKNVSSMDLATFLLKQVNRNVIDHLWMDNEGPEYALLPLMVREGILDKNNITVCQLNVELHWPLQTYSKMNERQFGEEIVLKFVRDSKFLPLDSYFIGHFRAFYINAYDDYCVERYLSDWCESKN